MSYLVSIIIPCYNSQTFLQEAIASATAQTYSHTEIIIIDDGSTDNSLEIIKSFGDKIRWETGENRGAPLARNRGIELAKGEYIKFLDADDILLPDCIEKQIAQATQLPPDRKAIVYGDAIWVDRHSQPIPNYPLRSRQPDEDAIAHILANSPLTSCPLHKRNYLLEIGGFDPSIPKGQEHDLHLRLVLSGVEFIYYSGAVYKYREYSDPNRISNSGLSRNGVMVHCEILQQQCKKIQEHTGKPLTSEVRKTLARRFWAYGRAVLREGYSEEAKSYFKNARELDKRNYIVGNAPYPMLVNLFGSIRAECILQRFKSLVKPTNA